MSAGVLRAALPFEAVSQGVVDGLAEPQPITARGLVGREHRSQPSSMKTDWTGHHAQRGRRLERLTAVAITLSKVNIYLHSLYKLYLVVCSATPYFSIEQGEQLKSGLGTPVPEQELPGSPASATMNPTLQTHPKNNIA